MWYQSAAWPEFPKVGRDCGAHSSQFGGRSDPRTHARASSLFSSLWRRVIHLHLSAIGARRDYLEGKLVSPLHEPAPYCSRVPPGRGLPLSYTRIVNAVGFLKPVQRANWRASKKNKRRTATKNFSSGEERKYTAEIRRGQEPKLVGHKGGNSSVINFKSNGNGMQIFTLSSRLMHSRFDHSTRLLGSN